MLTIIGTLAVIVAILCRHSLRPRDATAIDGSLVRPDPHPGIHPAWKAILGIFTVIAWAPLFLTFSASFIASSLGCSLDEGNVRPCVVAGWDIGEELYIMGMMLWLGFLTFPLVALTSVGWLVVWVLRKQ